MKASEAAKNALKFVMEAKSGEHLIIICDDVKSEVGNSFSQGAVDLGLKTKLEMLSTNDSVRNEIPKFLQEILERNKPELYLNILRDKVEEVPFRIKLIDMETRNRKSLLGHCPGVTLDMLTDGALALDSEEHRKMQEFARTLLMKLKNTSTVKVKSPIGTDLTFKTSNRPFFTDTYIDRETTKWMNLPTGEVIVAPLEESLEGTFVCDLAIGGIGPLNNPFKLITEKGMVKKTFSVNKSILYRVNKSLKTDEKSNIIGEFAIGINKKARLAQKFLELEKIFGTIHIAFGKNSYMPGGKNLSTNHMDFLISKPTVEIIKEDGKQIIIMKNGIFLT
jgi:leucyl aminopeptidase (aminopeptidase T)